MTPSAGQFPENDLPLLPIREGFTKTSGTLGLPGKKFWGKRLRTLDVLAEKILVLLKHPLRNALIAYVPQMGPIMGRGVLSMGL